jgi:mRNA interferase HicA
VIRPAPAKTDDSDLNAIIGAQNSVGGSKRSHDADPGGGAKKKRTARGGWVRDGGKPPKLKSNPYADIITTLFWTGRDPFVTFFDLDYNDYLIFRTKSYLTFGHFCPIIKTNMTGAEFIRKIKVLAKDRGVYCEFVSERGKGSHGTIYYGNRKTNVPNLKNELKTKTFHTMLKHLGIQHKDLL